MIEQITYEEASTKMPQAVNCLDYFRKMFLANLPEDIQKDVWIAGGAVKDWYEQGYVSKDVDFWGNSREAMAKLARHLRKTHDFKLYFSTKNAIKGYVTIRGKRINVDVVKHIFTDPDDCINQFDFTICCFAVSADKFYWHTSAPFDLLKKKIVVNNLRQPVDSMRRLVKYINKGYKTCNGTIMTISKAIAELDTNDESVFDFYKFD